MRPIYQAQLSRWFKLMSWQIEHHLWHLDLYRIENPEDAMQLGLDDAFVDAVCLIEWPDRLKNFCQRARFQSIYILADDDDLDDTDQIC